MLRLTLRNNLLRLFEISALIRSQTLLNLHGHSIISAAIIWLPHRGVIQEVFFHVRVLPDPPVGCSIEARGSVTRLENK